MNTLESLVREYGNTPLFGEGRLRKHVMADIFALVTPSKSTDLSKRLRGCNSETCGWEGETDRMLGAIGPICPQCGETTETLAAAPADVYDTLQELLDEYLTTVNSAYCQCDEAENVTAKAHAALAARKPVEGIDWERVAKVQDAKLRAMCGESGGMDRLREVLAEAKADQAEPIKKWQDRYALLSTGPNPLVAEQRKGACRDAEIADLRAALAARKPAAPSDRAQVLQEVHSKIRLRRSKQSPNLRDGMNKALNTVERMMLTTQAAPSIPAQAGVPDGCWLAPVELNDVMAALCDESVGDTITDGRSFLRGLWAELRAATPSAPSTLGQQVAAAQAEVAGWSDDKRASVRLEGGMPAAPPAVAAVAGVPDGWKLVPSLPDTEMCNQGMVHPNVSHRLARECYIAMLANSPAYFPASSVCPVCGIDTPHMHTSEQVVAHRNSLKTSAPSAPTAPPTVAGVPDDLDMPVQPEEIALNEWLDKTAWVQEQLSTFPAQSLGRHRADVMRDEIERLRLLEKTVLKDCIDEGCPFYGTAGVTCTPHPNGCTATAPSIPAQAGVPDGVALTADDITKVRRAKHRMVDALISSGVQYKKCGGISYHLERLIDSLAAQVQPVADGGEDA